MKVWLSKEAADLEDVTADMKDRLSSDLDRRERQLDETPNEAMERLQTEIADGESALEAIGNKIDYTEARADAVAEVDEILDLPSDEVEDSE